MPTLLLLANLAATWFLTGLVWFVQVVHYPLFCEVDPERFAAYHAAHVKLTTRVVVVPMCVELFASIGLVLFPPSGVAWPWVWVSLFLIVAIWVSTMLVQVRLHARLGAGWDRSVIRRLVATNLLRTFLWTTHALVLLYMVAAGLV